MGLSCQQIPELVDARDAEPTPSTLSPLGSLARPREPSGLAALRALTDRSVERPGNGCGRRRWARRVTDLRPRRGISVDPRGRRHDRERGTRARGEFRGERCLGRFASVVTFASDEPEGDRGGDLDRPGICLSAPRPPTPCSPCCIRCPRGSRFGRRALSSTPRRRATARCSTWRTSCWASSSPWCPWRSSCTCSPDRARGSRSSASMRPAFPRSSCGAQLWPP